MKSPILKNAVLNASLAALYIVAISFFMFYGEIFMGKLGDTVLAPIFMLCLLVFSVAMMGLLIFGRPVMWYMDGKKKEAVSLLLGTLGAFFVFIIVILIAVLLLQPIIFPAI
jgi:hypothetical protein